MKKEIEKEIREKLDHPNLIHLIEKKGDKYYLRYQTSLNLPWIYGMEELGKNRDCNFQNGFLFGYLFEEQQVPLFCLNCYKVDITLYTVEQVYAMIDLQSRLGLDSKTGSEGKRKDSDKRYGAYFYDNSLEAGRATFNLVRQEMFNIQLFVNELDLSYHDGDIILRKGCSKFATAVGPSDTWREGEHQALIEEVAYSLYGGPSNNGTPSKLNRAHNKEELLKYAYSCGDKTYLKFTGGVPYYLPPVTYQKE